MADEPDGKLRVTLEIPAEEADRLAGRIAEAVLSLSEEQRRVRAIAQYVLYLLQEQGLVLRAAAPGPAEPGPPPGNVARPVEPSDANC